MGVGEDFRDFCSQLTVNDRGTIAERYQLITRRLNLEFWDTDSRTANSFYAGSYGRGTAIRGFSDLDMIFRLPYDLYTQYNGHTWNGQSALLQAVRDAVRKTYPSSSVGGDGQVVVVAFTDGLIFEIVPAFINKDGSYTFPDSNSGGRWRTTDPKPEIRAISDGDANSNGNLKWLCRMMRSWKIVWAVPIGGLLIDTLACRFMEGWAYREKSFLYYDFMSRDFFDYLRNEPERDFWCAVGSGRQIPTKGTFQHKATRCRNLAIDAITCETAGKTWSARQTWREIYGTLYTDRDP